MMAASPLPLRPLGASGPMLPAIGLGCMSFSGVYGAVTEEEAIRLIHAAIDRGVTHLDTSDAYGFGHNESLLGRALPGRRERVFLATKFGQIRRPDGSSAIDGSPAHVRRACEESLRRLGVEVIDLYYQHRSDPAVPVEETVGEMARLVQEGKVRFLGLSEAAPERIRRAQAVHPIAAVQTEYSLLYRQEAEETRRLTRALGIAFVAYAPLGRGLLAGAIRSAEDVDGRRAQHPRFAPENLGHNLALVARLQDIAQQKGCSLAQLGLAWLLAQGEDVLPIIGTRSIAHLEENLGALSLRLTAEEIAAIAAAVPAGAAAGTRYPPAQMRNVYL